MAGVGDDFQRRVRAADLRRAEIERRAFAQCHGQFEPREAVTDAEHTHVAMRPVAEMQLDLPDVRSGGARFQHRDLAPAFAGGHLDDPRVGERPELLDRSKVAVAPRLVAGRGEGGHRAHAACAVTAS